MYCIDYHANDCWPAKGVSNNLLNHAKCNSQCMDLCIAQLPYHVTRTTPNNPPEIPWKNHMYLDQLVDGGVSRSVQTCICTCVVMCGHVTECPFLRSVQTGGVRVVSSVLARQSLVECINWGHRVVLYLLQLSSP